MSLVSSYRDGFQKGIIPTHTLVEATGMEFDILITGEDEEYEFGEEKKEIAIVVIDGAGEIFF